MVAAVCCKDTAPLPAFSVNSPANRLVPSFFASASPLESADPKLLTSAHSKRLTENLSPAESAVTKTGGILPPPFVTPLELSPSSAASISCRINGLRTLCTNQLIKNCCISRSFIRLRTLAKTMGGGTTYSTPKRRLEASVTKWGAPKRRPYTGKESGVEPPYSEREARLGGGRYKTQERRLKPTLLGGFLGGSDFLPAAGALAELQNLFSEADGFGGDFDELVVGDEFDGLFEAELAMGNEAN